MIEITGLPVGHTHEDIDQMFSSISRALLGGKSRAQTIVINTRDEFDDFLRNKVHLIILGLMASESKFN